MPLVFAQNNTLGLLYIKDMMRRGQRADYLGSKANTKPPLCWRIKNGEAPVLRNIFKGAAKHIHHIPRLTQPMTKVRGHEELVNSVLISET